MSNPVLTQPEESIQTDAIQADEIDEEVKKKENEDFSPAVTFAQQHTMGAMSKSSICDLNPVEENTELSQVLLSDTDPNQG